MEPLLVRAPPFLRAPAPDRAHPDGCVVLLEDGAGGCARDARGRPILLSLGMTHGSAAEMQKQMVYALERASLHRLPGHARGECCTVIEVRPREPGAAVTFRFPDKDVRTLFDLQEVTAAISERTGHLPGVAIAVMGCIVNGPGEMADADFGYVGGAPGKIDLYVGKEVVKRGIDNDTACDELIQLIKDHGRWVDKEEEEEAVAA